MSYIDIHADDFAVSYHASQDIISLCKKGVLDSISIIPNMSCFDKSINLFQRERTTFPHEVLISIHLNFMEGHCVADTHLVPHLVDRSGNFSVSWGSLLLASYNPLKRRVIQNELAVEIKAQIDKIKSTGIITDDIRIDSHQHPHMIPVVRDALCQVVNSHAYRFSFIRNSREPLSVYLKHPSVFFSCSFINVVKCTLLNLLSHTVVHSLRKESLADGYLCGVLFSGCMNQRLSKIANDLYCFSEKKKRPLEILFHPGSVNQNEITSEYCKPGFVLFHLSKNRHIEYQTVCSLYDQLKSRK